MGTEKVIFQFELNLKWVEGGPTVIVIIFWFRAVELLYFSLNYPTQPIIYPIQPINYPIQPIGNYPKLDHGTKFKI